MGTNAAFDDGKIALLGVPSSAGARKVGQEQGPGRLREFELLESLRSTGREVVDLGDLDPITYSPDVEYPKRQNLHLVLKVVEDVSRGVEDAVASGARPLVIGGDCSITFGVVAALTKRFEDLGLIYFDGDVDLNTPDSTISGVFDGMVLAHILGDGVEALSHLGPRQPLLDEHRVTLFGYSEQAGGIDPVEVERLRLTRMAKHPLEEIQNETRAAAARALRELEKRAQHILVHFDVDVIDLRDFPAVDVPHSPGLSLSKAQEALEVFLGSPKVVGLVVAEFNGGHDTDGKLATRLSELIGQAMSYDS